MVEFQNSTHVFDIPKAAKTFIFLNYHLSGCLITCLDLLCSWVKTEALQCFDLLHKSSSRTDSISRWKRHYIDHVRVK